MPIQEEEDPRELRKDYNKLIWKLFAERVKKTPTGWTLLLGAGNAAPEDAKLFQALDANHFLTLTIGCSWVEPHPSERQVLSLCLDFNDLADLKDLADHLKSLDFPVSRIVVDRGVNVHLHWSEQHLLLIYEMLPRKGELFIDQTADRKYFYSLQDIKDVENTKDNKKQELTVQMVETKVPVLGKGGQIMRYILYLQKQVVFKPNYYSWMTIYMVDKKLPFIPWTQEDQIQHNMKLIQSIGFRLVKVMKKEDQMRYPVRDLFPFIYAVK